MASATECACCCDDLVWQGAEANGVEYRVAATAPWLRARYCQSCLKTIMDAKFDTYMQGVVKADCAAELRRLLDKGPPIYMVDPEALPVKEGEHVHELRHASDGKVVSAMVKNAVTGKAHQELWDKLRKEHSPRLDELPEQSPGK